MQHFARLIWFGTVCQCPTKRTLGLYGLSKIGQVLGFKQGFSCINVCQVPWERIKTTCEAQGFKPLPRDQANVNVFHRPGPIIIYERLSEQQQIGPPNHRSEHLKLHLFPYPSIKTCVLGAQKNRLNETVLLSTHNICFG